MKAIKLVAGLALSATLAAPAFSETGNPVLDDPARFLQFHFQNYQTIQLCVDGRSGMVEQVINADDHSVARQSIKAINEKVRAENPSIDPEAIWKKTLDEFGDLSTTTAFYNEGMGAIGYTKNHQDVIRGSSGQDRRRTFFDNVRTASTQEVWNAVGIICRAALAEFKFDVGVKAPDVKVKKDF